MQYVDLPPREAIYEILRTCLAELISKGVVSSVVSLAYMLLIIYMPYLRGFTLYF